MNRLTLPLILLAAYFGIYLQSSFSGLRHLGGLRLPLLPVLLAFTAIRMDPVAIVILSGVGGLCQDALSANPLGSSVLPMVVVGMGLWHYRQTILHREVYAQVVLGLLTCGIVQLLGIGLLVFMGKSMLLGWGTVWHWASTTALGGALTPLVFFLFQRLERQLNYPSEPETTLRRNREIKRGRS